MLVTPRIDPSSFMRSLKGFTAREINKTLGLSGALWQKESYDHWVRNEDEFDKIRRYIENNPVKAGLVSKPEDFPWSSAYIDMNVDAAR
jgi:putative DNA methylase